MKMEKTGAKHMEKSFDGKPQVIFLGGYLCSGKGTYCDRILQEYTRIGVSDIVKQIIGKATRKELQDTAHLDSEVGNRIIDILTANPTTKFVIDGIRQRTIYWRIKNFLDIESERLYQLIWLDVSIEECKRRFEAKHDGKENISFEKAFENDKALGLLELEKIWRTHHCTIVKQ